MSLLALLADGVFEGALGGAIKGAIIGGIAGALIWVGIQVYKRVARKDDSDEGDNPR